VLYRGGFESAATDGGLLRLLRGHAKLLRFYGAPPAAVFASAGLSPPQQHQHSDVAVRARVRWARSCTSAGCA
jgi:hypothetical protein